MLSTKAVHSQGWLQWLLSTADKVATTTPAAKLHGAWTGFLLCMQGSSLGEFDMCLHWFLEKERESVQQTVSRKN